MCIIHKHRLVERFNQTLRDMLAKTVKERATDWDEKVFFVLYTYRVSVQKSSKEFPFFVFCGRDPRLPTEQALSPTCDRQQIDIDTYKSEVIERLSSAW